MAFLTRRTPNSLLRLLRFSEPFTLTNLQTNGLPPIGGGVATETNLGLTEEGDTILTEESSNVLTEEST